MFYIKINNRLKLPTINIKGYAEVLLAVAKFNIMKFCKLNKLDVMNIYKRRGDPGNVGQEGYFNFAQPLRKLCRFMMNIIGNFSFYNFSQK